MPGQSTRAVDGGRIPGSAEISGGVEIRLLFQLANQKVASVRTFGRNQGSFIASVPIANSLHTAIGTAWSNNLNPYINNSVIFLATTVRDMSLSTNPEFRSTANAVHTGTGATAMPQDAAIVLTAEANERGRGAKGRLYLVGWATTANTAGGQINDTARTAVNAFGLDLYNALVAQSLQPAVAKPARQEYIGLTGTSHNARPAHMADVSAYICQNNEWDTQRRRGL